MGIEAYMAHHANEEMRARPEKAGDTVEFNLGPQDVPVVEHVQARLAAIKQENMGLIVHEDDRYAHKRVQPVAEDDPFRFERYGRLR